MISISVITCTWNMWIFLCVERVTDRDVHLIWKHFLNSTCNMCLKSLSFYTCHKFIVFGFFYISLHLLIFCLFTHQTSFTTSSNLIHSSSIHILLINILWQEYKSWLQRYVLDAGNKYSRWSGRHPSSYVTRRSQAEVT